MFQMNRHVLSKDATYSCGSVQQYLPLALVHISVRGQIWYLQEGLPSRASHRSTTLVIRQTQMIQG